MVCEKCWEDAFNRSFVTGKDQSECYQELLIERMNNPCSQKEQAGDYWNQDKQCDSRALK